MRPERNPLDLNNLPEDSTRDHGKQVSEESSSYSGSYRKKKSGGKDAKDECGKVYECRFCSLKFCKSQALGGHMNRHRQERETETLNRARQLVYNNDNMLVQGPSHLGSQQIPRGGFQQAGNLGDPTLQFRSLYPSRIFSSGGGTSTTLLTPPTAPPGSLRRPPALPQQPYMQYTPPSRLLPFPSQYPPHGHHHPTNDYIVGHAVPGTTNPNYPPPSSDTNYTCIGAISGHGPLNSNGTKAVGGGSSGGVKDMTFYDRFQ